jgi:hypothetical protein
MKILLEKSGDPVPHGAGHTCYENQKRETKMQNSVISIGSDNAKY